MIETTATTVITPMMTPRSVRKLRSLCVLRAVAAMRMVSIAGCRLLALGKCRRPAPESRPPRAESRSGFLLLFLLLFHLRAVFDLAQCLEGACDDFLAFFQPGDDLDVALAGEARLHDGKFRLPVLADEHALFFFGLARF